MKKSIFLIIIVLMIGSIVNAKNISVNIKGVYWIHHPADKVFGQFGPYLDGDDWVYVNGSGTYFIQDVDYWLGNDYAYSFVQHLDDTKGSGINNTIAPVTTNIIIYLPQSSPLPPPPDNND